MRQSSGLEITYLCTQVSFALNKDSTDAKVRLKHFIGIPHTLVTMPDNLHLIDILKRVLFFVDSILN